VTTVEYDQLVRAVYALTIVTDAQFTATIDPDLRRRMIEERDRLHRKSGESSARRPR
jgi:hypothetical protein